MEVELWTSLIEVIQDRAHKTGETFDDIVNSALGQSEPRPAQVPCRFDAFAKQAESRRPCELSTIKISIVEDNQSY